MEAFSRDRQGFWVYGIQGSYKLGTVYGILTLKFVYSAYRLVCLQLILDATHTMSLSILGILEKLSGTFLGRKLVYHTKSDSTPRPRE